MVCGDGNRRLSVINWIDVGGSTKRKYPQKRGKYLCETARMNGEVSSKAIQLLNNRLDTISPSIRFMVDLSQNLLASNG